MKLEKGIISSFQLYLLIFSYILGSSLLISIISPISKHNSWLAILLGLIEGILFAFIYISLSKKFPDKSIIKINTIIYGKYPGKIISFLYIIFLIPLISLNLRYFGDFFVNLIMQETPLVAFMITIGLLSTYAVKKGLEVLTRCSFLIISIAIFIEVITFFLID